MMGNSFLFCLVFAINIQGIFLLPNSRPWHWERVYDEKAPVRVGKPVARNDVPVADKTKDAPVVVKPVAVLSEKVKDVAKEDEKVKKDTPAHILLPKSIVPGRKFLDHHKRDIPGPGHDYIQHLTQKQIDECVKNTNDYRSRHVDTPNLQWDEELAKGAQEWAQRLMKAKVKEWEECYNTDGCWTPSGDWYQHATDKQKGKYHGQYIGENLFAGENYQYYPAFTCQDANKSWYDEIKDYDFNKPGFTHGTGHFTAVVWKETTKFGMGIAFVDYADYDSGEYWNFTITVARYAPGGNLIGTFKENVKPLK